VAAYWFLGPEPEPPANGQTDQQTETDQQRETDRSSETEQPAETETDQPTEPDRQTETDQPTGTEQGTEADQPTEEPPAAEPACAGAATRLTSESASGEQWLAAVEACRGEGDGEALVGVLDACMAAGHPRCLLEMGRCYDPRHEASAACGIALYPEIAADYYNRAAEAGAEGAAAELESLCDHLNETDPEQATLAGC
jgi:TPR repeat protein